MVRSWRRKAVPLGAALVVMLIFVTAIIVSLQRRPLREAPIVADLAVSDSGSYAPGAIASSAIASQPSPPPPAKVEAPRETSSGDIAPMTVSVPRLAYTYRLGFRLAGGRLAEVQEAHRALCLRMGPSRCQLIAMSRSVEGETQAPARLNLRVASIEAKTFSDRLTGIVAGSGGKTMATSVTAEDVSKAIVDAEARIRQRELLVSRLTEILRTRRGTVGELVEAERSVAEAQEELDQTKGWLTELRGRVAMSDFEIGYSQTETPKAEEPREGPSVLDALGGSLSGFLMTLRILLLIAIWLAPWVLIGVPVALWLRRTARRKRDSETLPATSDA